MVPADRNASEYVVCRDTISLLHLLGSNIAAGGTENLLNVRHTDATIVRFLLKKQMKKSITFWMTIL